MATQETAPPALPSTGPDPLQEKTSGPVKHPIRDPNPGCRPQARAVLTVDQQTKYDWLLARAKSWTSIPAHTKGKTNEDTGPPTDDEREWLTRECLLRYLRATKWQPKQAEVRLLDTLAWRREYGVAALTHSHISPENETGKQLLLGFDRQARPLHFLSPPRQNTAPSPRQVQHLVFMVERVIDLMPAGQESLTLLINFKSNSAQKNTAPGLGTARECLHILQTHYPERLGRALIINVPWIVQGFFKLITPFIDPMTREKLKFNEDLTTYVPPDQLWTDFNGTLNFEYDHAVYWPALQALCAERRASRHERWLAGGKQIGESEDYLAGATDAGIGGTVQKMEEAEAESGAETRAEHTQVDVTYLKGEETKSDESKATHQAA